LQNKRQSFDLSFLEVAGETLRTVETEGHRHPNLSETLQRFLINQNIKLNFVFVIDPENDNEDLFRAFFDFVEKNLRVSLKTNKFGLLIVLTKPKAALKKMKVDPKYLEAEGAELFKNIEIMNGDAVRFFININSPTVYRRWDLWNKKKRGMMPFNIGQIAGEGKNEKLIVPNFFHSRHFLEWNYEQFTGKKLQPPFFERIKKWFKS
jgi:hypothetical protein